MPSALRESLLCGGDSWKENDATDGNASVDTKTASSATLLEESFASYAERYRQTPLPFNANHQAYAARRRQENRERFPEFGPARDVLLTVPETAPGHYLKRFTPGGRFLLAFGGESRFFVYPVRYSGTFQRDAESMRAPDSFSDFFGAVAAEVDVAIPSVGDGRVATLLCRDFCLCLQDASGRDSFVILAASVPAVVGGEPAPPRTVLVTRDTCEAVGNDCNFVLPCLDHVTFFLVSLTRMKVVDFVSFKYDYVYLSHHLGVSLRTDGATAHFSVLSMKNQQVHLFVIDQDEGRFVRMGAIGRNSPSGEETDSQSFAESQTFAGSQTLTESRAQLPLINDQLSTSDARWMADRSWPRPGIHGLMRSVAAFLWREQMQQRSGTGAGIHAMLEHLHIWKHQRLADGFFLFRLAAASLILSSNPRHQSAVHAPDPLAPTQHHSFLVLYAVEEERVWAVCNGADERLGDWIETNWHRLRWPCGDDESLGWTIRSIFRATLQMRPGATPSDPALVLNACLRRLGGVVPAAPQQTPQSPLLDASVFRWDGRITAALSRQTPLPASFFAAGESMGSGGLAVSGNYGADPVRFYSRVRANLLSHVLHFSTDMHEETPPLDRHRWFILLLHPTLPLILVYQYGLFRSVNVRVFYN